jgi:HEAT repeat protein
MEPLSTFFGSIASRIAVTKVFNAGWDKANSRLNPDEMVVLLQQAEVAADTAQPELGGLFRRIDRDGATGYHKFLKFFQSGEVLTELQKPLKDGGNPDVNILVEAFTRSASEHPESENHLSDQMPLWMETFVESYFEQVKGICFKVAKVQYLEQLSQRVNKVKFVGMAVQAGEVETQKGLVQIFVMPDVREKRSGVINDIDIDYGCILDSAPKDLSRQEYQELKGFVQQKNLLQEQKKWALRDRSAPRVSAPKILDLAQKKVVLLGAPGSGKTMLSSYFTLMLCQSNPTEISLDAKVELPILVRIRDWISKPEQGLLSYLRWDAEANLSINNLPLGFFEHWLKRGQALILLDGLDEVVNEAQQSKVVEKIETFLHEYKNNPAVITSRPAGYRGAFNLDEFPHYTLESFDDKQVETFIDHWYDSRFKDDKAQAERRKVDLQKAFARNDRIRLLARNPLLLTLITLIHRDGGELPKQRYKLYERAVEMLLIQWDCARDIKLDPKNILFKSEDLLYVLKKISYWIHTQGSIGETEGGTLIDKDELMRQLRTEIKTLKKCESHEATAEAKRFIDFIRERTGLLNEQGIDCYAFVHKTFQEYLTAEEIYEADESGEDTEIIGRHFREHLHDQHWREVLLLLVSKLKGKKAQNAIQAVLDTNSEYEQWLHRNLLFAGWCLTEDPSRLTIVAANWVGGILDRLVELEVGKSLLIGRKISHEASKILYCFGETSVEKDVWEKLKLQKERIDPIRLAEFQAKLGKKRKALDTLLLLLDENDKNLDMRTNTVLALGRLGNGDKNTEIKLLSLLNDQESDIVLSNASSALVRLGNSTVENTLLLLLNDPKPQVRSRVIKTLGWLGNGSTEVVNKLLLLLYDPKPRVRASAISVLGKLGNSNVEVVKKLLSLLPNANVNVRSTIASALGKLGNSNVEVVKELLSLLSNNTDVNVRSSAASALGKLGNSNVEVVKELLSLLSNNTDVNVRSSAASALGQLGNNSTEVVNTLLSLLNDTESGVVRLNAVSALIQLENNSAEVFDALLSLLKDTESSVVRSSAAVALGQSRNSSENVVNALISLLNSRNSSIRISASSALVQLAKTSDTIRPEVLQWLEQNPNDDGIGNAIDCLWSIVVE